MSENKKSKYIRIGIFFIILIFTVLLIINRNNVKGFARYGYPGIFLVSLFSNATLIMPIPGIAFTSAMGAVFNPFWVAIAAGTGAALGEITGYLAGFSGQVIVSKKEWYDQVVNWMARYGFLTILIMAIIPNPIFDLAGMAAGMMKMPFPKFLIWTLIGKIIKMLLFAYSGATIFNYFLKFI